jgi:hypothetical protein
MNSRVKLCMFLLAGCTFAKMLAAVASSRLPSCLSEAPSRGIEGPVDQRAQGLRAWRLVT